MTPIATALYSISIGSGRKDNTVWVIIINSGNLSNNFLIYGFCLNLPCFFFETHFLAPRSLLLMAFMTCKEGSLKIVFVSVPFCRGDDTSHGIRWDYVAGKNYLFSSQFNLAYLLLCLYSRCIVCGNFCTNALIKCAK